MMHTRYLCAALLFLVLLSAATAQSEPRILAPMATGGAPPCPDHFGVRTFRSAVIRGGDASVSIGGSARRDANGCQQLASLNVEHAGVTKSYPLPDAAKQTFEIVDFSPDRSELLLDRQVTREEPNELLRYVELTTMPVGTGEMHWQNVWDLLGWKDCDAVLYPQGFTASSEVVLIAQPSVMSRLRRDNCVTTPTLYAINLQLKTVAQMPDNATLERYGKVLARPSLACKSDPDLAGACFTVHGRLSAWNGSPTWRISWTGTKRVLGVTTSKLPNSVDEVLPDSLAKVGSNVNAYGDFLVCPFTRSKPGAMQMICIESASNVTYKPR